MGGGRHVACTGKRRGAHTVLVGRPEGQGPLVRRRCRCDNNIKMDPQTTGLGSHKLDLSGSRYG
jgi:hypothetical protein